MRARMRIYVGGGGRLHLLLSRSIGLKSTDRSDMAVVVFIVLLMLEAAARAVGQQGHIRSLLCLLFIF